MILTKIMILVIMVRVESNLITEDVMLVLRRKKDESIVIGGDIVITVIDIQGNTVRLGIEAPDRTGIWRSELVDVEKRSPRTLD